MTTMYKDFCEKFPDMVSYEFYRQRSKEYNISLCKLGEEECDFCLSFKLHAHDDISREEDTYTVGEFIYIKNCEICDEHLCHMEVATILRKEYRKDVEKSFSDTEKCFAVDMQKVIMLPVMCGVKSCLFTPHLAIYHLTFALLGGKTYSKEKPTGVIWHDEISGRKDEDVTSGYIKLLKSLRDVRDVLIWSDNCSSQNKCWTLYTVLVFYQNSPGVLFTTLTIKYFEPGHTFMAADPFHHVVESKIRSKKFYGF